MLEGKINEEIQMNIGRYILYLNAINDNPITLFIDTQGGDTEISLYICDAIQQSRAEVHGIVTAEALSAGFRILQSCHRRLAYPNALLMFHAPTGPSKRCDAKDWGAFHKDSLALHKEQLDVYATRSKQPLKWLKKWSLQEKRFKAHEAFDLGFLDEVMTLPKK